MLSFLKYLRYSTPPPINFGMLASCPYVSLNTSPVTSWTITTPVVEKHERKFYYCSRVGTRWKNN